MDLGWLLGGSWIFVPPQCAEKSMLREPRREPSPGRVWNFILVKGCGGFVEISGLVLRLRGGAVEEGRRLHASREAE